MNLAISRRYAERFHPAVWLVLAALALGLGGSTAAASTVTKFTGGDSGEGLNLTGTYVYAVNVNGPAGNTVQGLTFTADPGTAAVTISAPYSTAKAVNYGSTTDDLALNAIMTRIRYGSSTVPVAVNYNVTPGNIYRVQLLLDSTAYNPRTQDITVDGVTVADNLVLAGPPAVGPGTLVSYTYVAGSPVTQVLIGPSGLAGGNPVGGDNNAVLNALTVQQVTGQTVGYWRLDDAIAGSPVTTAASTVNNAQLQGTGGGTLPVFSADVPGGTILDGVGGTPVGANATSVQFGGGNYVDVPFSPLLEPSDFTVEFFMKAGPQGGWPGIVQKPKVGGGTAVGPGNITWGVGKNNGELEFARVDTQTEFNRTFTVPNGTADGQWHHFALTSSGNTWRLYRDYGLVSTITSQPIDYDGTSGLRFGWAPTDFQAYNGLADEIRFSNTALNPAQFLAVSSVTLHWDGGDANGANGANGGAGTWDTNLTANWYPGSGTTDVQWTTPGPNDAVFGGTGGTVTIAGPGATARWVTFDAPGYTIQGSPLALVGGGVVANQDATISASISGFSGVAKSGTGMLTLGGANTFTGGLAIDDGEVRLGNAAALYAATPNLLVFGSNANTKTLTLNGFGATVGGLSTGATVGTSTVQNASATAATLTINTSPVDTHTYAGSLVDGAGGGALSLVKTGPGTQVLAGPNIVHTGATTIQGGTLEIADGWVNYTSPTTVNAGATLVVNSSIPFSPFNKWYSFAAMGGAGTMNKTGTGAFFFSGPLSFTGQVNVLQGRLGNDNLAANYAANTADLDVAFGAEFDLRAQGAVWDALTGSGTVLNSYGYGGANVLTLGVANGSGTFTGAITGSGDGVSGEGNGLTGLTKTGTGTQTLVGAGITYSGPTTVNGGTLVLQDATAFAGGITNNATVEFNESGSHWLPYYQTYTGGGTWVKSGAGTLWFRRDVVSPTGQINVTAGKLGNDNLDSDWSNASAGMDISNGATFDLRGDHVRVDKLTGSGAVTNSYGRPASQVNQFGDLGQNNLTVGAAGGSGTFSGTIQDGAGRIAVTKIGAGTQTLSGTIGANSFTYTGPTTVQNGTLELINATGFNSPITIDPGATLRVNSSVPFATRWNYAQALSGGGTLTKTGTGVFGVYGPVNLSGQINVQQGTLHNDNLTANWSGSTAGVDVSPGAVLDLRGNDITVDALSGAGTVGNSYGNGTNVLTVGVANGSGTFSGVIQGSGSGLPGEGNGRTALVKTGSGTQTLTGPNTFSGGTTISGGTLRIGFLASSTLWLDATDSAQIVQSGSAVSQWQDKFGNSSPLAQADANRQPSYVASGIGGLPSIHFSTAGTPDVLYNTEDYTAPITIFSVSRLTGGTNLRLITSNSNNWLLGYWGGGMDEAYFQGWVSNPGATPDTNPHMYEAVIPGAQPGNSELYVYDSRNPDVTLVAANRGGVTGPNGLALGGWGTGASEASDGDVGEILIFAGMLDATQRQYVENYLLNKWFGTSRPLPNLALDVIPDTAPVSITAAGATLDLNGFNETIGPLSGVAGSAVTLGSGTLTVNSTADSDFAGAISGSGGLTKIGTAALTLSRTSSYTGATAVDAGTLIVNGSIAPSSGVTVAAGAILSGHGQVPGIRGGGLVSPGTSPGILTSPSVDASGGLDFAFEFSGPDPDYGYDFALGENSLNDVLRLTSSTPFAATPPELDLDNAVSIYFDLASVHVGDTFHGGFYTDTGADFLGMIQDADFHYFMLGDGQGPVLFNNRQYYSLDGVPGLSQFLVETVPAPAHFLGGDAGGFVMQLTAVPEPSTWVLAGFGLLGAGIAGWRRRRRAR